MLSPSLNNILFLDIETVPQYASYDAVPELGKEFWNKKAQMLRKDKEFDTPETLYDRAGIYAEFGKIVCLSCGIISGSGDDKKITLKSFCCDEEKTILADFSDMLKKWSGVDRVLCAHNGKEFDFPYLSRRMVINQLPVPDMLQLAGKRPWEIPHIDTLELWKFGDYKSYTSLNLLAYILGIPTPKDDIDGSMVWRVYWQEQDLKRIVTYCQKDVITVAQVYLRLIGESCISESNVEIKNG
jgi:3'-5' exonuclease